MRSLFERTPCQRNVKFGRLDKLLRRQIRRSIVLPIKVDRAYQKEPCTGLAVPICHNIPIGQEVGMDMARIGNDRKV